MYKKIFNFGVYIYRVNISPGEIIVIWGNVYAYALANKVLWLILVD